MTRIIAGRAGGRRLATPPGAGTRPTTERTREAIFSRLAHLGVLDDADVLDLYAGSGALGLEAVSRGARGAVLVEAARPVARVARANAATLGVGVVTVVAEPVARALRGGQATGPFDVVFSDPPYDLPEDDLAADLLALAEPGRLRPQAVVVVERSIRSPEPAWPAGPQGLCRFDERAYGETRVWYAEPASSSTDGGEVAGGGRV